MTTLTHRMTIISSAQNDHIKSALRLQEKNSSRRQQQQFFVEGLREVGLAIDSGYTLLKLFCEESCLGDSEMQRLITTAIGKNPSLLMLQVSSPIFAKMTVRGHGAKVAAIFHAPQPTLEDLKLPANPLLIITDGIEKPGNLGALFRTADAFAVDGVIICGESVDPLNPNTVRASLGALFSVPWVCCSTEDCLTYMKSKKIALMGAVLAEDSTPLTAADLSGPCALVMGSEAWGVSQMMAAALDKKLIIPMNGKVDSLNVANAAAILIYECWRQRHADRA